MAIEEDRRRYAAAPHAVQTGVAYQMTKVGDVAAGTTPKHLRVGVNSAMAPTLAGLKFLGA